MRSFVLRIWLNWIALLARPLVSMFTCLLEIAWWKTFVVSSTWTCTRELIGDLGTCLAKYVYIKRSRGDKWHHFTSWTCFKLNMSWHTQVTSADSWTLTLTQRLRGPRNFPRSSTFCTLAFTYQLQLLLGEIGSRARALQQKWQWDCLMFLYFAICGKRSIESTISWTIQSSKVLWLYYLIW